jgi:xanthine dehydrogenase accessory factor
VNELKAILESARAGDVLATIVRTEGSSYRRPGAHMLIRADGTTIGSTSGGCLEQDVIAQAAKVASSGKEQLLRYDTTSEEDVIFGAGLGCKGVIEIFLERLDEGNEKLATIAKIFRERSSGVIATKIRDDFIFEEEIHAPTPLFIFGAGFDAIPLCRLAKELGFEVTVVDRRPAYVTGERFPMADAVILAGADEIGKVPLNDRSAAVVMCHHYISDRDYLRALLGRTLRYLGLMGPRKRAEKMLAEFREEGFLIGESALNRLHNPVGLDIGAEGPEQIALAVLAEINAVFAGHGGTMLREKKGPIHSPRTELP